MTTSDINNLLSKFAAARLKRAEGPIQAPRVTNPQMQERVTASPNFADFQAANPPIPGYGAPYYEGNDLFSGWRGTGHQGGLLNQQGGPSYNFNQYQSAPWASPAGMFANPVTNWFTGTSGTGVVPALAAGFGGYLAGKGMQNFDLLRAGSLANMTPGARENFVARQISGGNPSNLPAGTQATFKPNGGGASIPLTGQGGQPLPPGSRAIGGAANGGGGRPSAAAPVSPRSISESLASRGVNPQGGGLIVQPPAGPKGTAPAPTRIRVPGAETAMTRPGPRGVPVPTAQGLRSVFAPKPLGGTSSSGLRGWGPMLLGLGTTAAAFAPNIWNAFKGEGSFNPQVQSGAARLDAPVPTAPPTTLLGADQLSPRR